MAGGKLEAVWAVHEYMGWGGGEGGGVRLGNVGAGGRGGSTAGKSTQRNPYSRLVFVVVLDCINLPAAAIAVCIASLYSLLDA